VISLLGLRSEWRRGALRTNLWLVPGIEVILAVGLYFGTHALDKAAFGGTLALPSWMVFGTADAARQILTPLAAAVITVVGVVFSITTVTLTLASTQFGPRILRTFIRDRGTQFTLGTFVYATLVLISIGPASPGRNFVPHLSITIAVGLVTLSMAVLIFHPPHRDVDPAAAGDREHRQRLARSTPSRVMTGCCSRRARRCPSSCGGWMTRAERFWLLRVATCRSSRTRR